MSPISLHVGFGRSFWRELSYIIHGCWSMFWTTLSFIICEYRSVFWTRLSFIHYMWMLVNVLHNAIIHYNVDAGHCFGPGHHSLYLDTGQCFGPLSQFILPPGQVAPRGASQPRLPCPPGGKLSREILPPTLVIFTPGGQAVQAGLSCPPPNTSKNIYMLFCYFSVSF